jgi:hypothetical protein
MSDQILEQLAQLSSFDSTTQIKAVNTSGGTAPSTEITPPSNEYQQVRALLGDLANYVPNAKLPRSGRRIRNLFAAANTPNLLGGYDIVNPNILDFTPTTFAHLLVLVELLEMPVTLPIVQKIRECQARWQ